MSDMKSKIEFIYNGGNVQRFHTNRTIHGQNVAQHSHGVALLVWLMTEGACSKDLIVGCLTHDLPEQVTGDIPSPFKRSLPLLREATKQQEEFIFERVGFRVHQATEQERKLVSLADAMDGILCIAGERRLGNRALDGVADTFLGYANNLMYESQPWSPTVWNIWNSVLGIDSESRKG